MSRLVRHPVAAFLAVMVVTSALALGAGFQLSKVTEIAIYTLYGLGVNVLLAYTGLVPFGASLFFGLGSYAVALGVLQAGFGEVAGLILAAAFCCALGLVVGLLVLRRSGLYFSLLTLACSQLAFEIVFKWTEVTGGENGLQGVVRPWLASDLAFHVFAVATVAVAMAVLWQIVHSPFGRTLQAIRDNDRRAAGIGYDVFRYKLGAFVIAATFIGYAGGLLAFLLRGAYANNLNWQQAGDPLIMTVLGGVHHFVGPVWGSLAFIILTDQLSALLDQWWLIFAPIIAIFVLVSPDGLCGLVQRIRRVPLRWSLVRPGIPPRPARIAPLASARPAPADGGPVLSVRHVSKRFGSLVAANDVVLDVAPNRLHSLIGPNGAGKTTLFNMLTGYLTPDEGQILFLGQEIGGLKTHERIRLGISRSFQIITVFPHLTAFESVRVAVQATDPLRRGLFRDAHALGTINAKTWSILAAVGLEDRAGETCQDLSHGEKRLLDIAIALAADAALLLLDEPLAGLADADRERVGQLIRRLAADRAVILIEHDIDRVLALSDRVTVLHQGRIIADGAPDLVAQDPGVIEAYMGKSGQAPAPRATDRAGKPRPAGDVLLDVAGLRAGYQGSLVLNDLDFRVHRGEVVALLGRNGVGKTTLLRAISGVVAAHGGQVSFAGRRIDGSRPDQINRLGINVVPEGRRLFPNLTVLENLEIARRPGGAQLEEVYGLFPKLRILQRSRAENLSGGEQQMVAIARALMAPAELILLDEPFEGLAPAIVAEIMEAVVRLRERASVVIVEHKAELILPIADRAYVLVNGTVAWSGSAQVLEADADLQARFLGLGHGEMADVA